MNLLINQLETNKQKNLKLKIKIKKIINNLKIIIL
jgi:hypothetical protein